MLQTTERYRTVRIVGKIERSFTPEKASARSFSKFTRIRFEAVFQNKTDFQSIAEVFFTLDPDTGTEAHA